MRCSDIDECVESVLEQCAGDDDVCINTRGSHFCQTITCPTGFVKAPQAASYTAGRNRLLHSHYHPPIFNLANTINCAFFESTMCWMYYRSETDGRCCICADRRQHCYVKWRQGRHLECMTSNRKSDSVNRCVFTWRTILPNFILIQFETTDPYRLFWRGAGRPNKNKNNKKKMISDMRSVTGLIMKYKSM